MARNEKKNLLEGVCSPKLKAQLSLPHHFTVFAQWGVFLFTRSQCEQAKQMSSLEEKKVPSTKTFHCQVTILALLCLQLSPFFCGNGYSFHVICTGTHCRSRKSRLTSKPGIRKTAISMESENCCNRWVFLTHEKTLFTVAKREFLGFLPVLSRT